MVMRFTPRKKPPIAQRNPWPVVGTKVWVPESVYAGCRDSGDIARYRPKQRLVLAVGVDFVIFDDGPELNIKVCRKTRAESLQLCEEWSLTASRIAYGLT